MKTLIKYFTTICMLLFLGQFSYAQSDKIEKEPLIVDDIQIDVKSVQVDAKKKTISIELFLTSYTKGGRELKMNTYGIQAVDTKGEKHFFGTIGLGNVLVKLEDKQNYMNYFMKMDEPVLMKVVVFNWVKGKPKELLVVFEDSEEEGHYIETAVQL
ncbi:hypothetical protein ACFX5U_19895 [Sphingobacterium sp. SG20118]|uniref:hypothetical protein n=1 Tax=Sphingobacterium TaxID=28453 RepID=UPI002469436C|nr:hypothetical protein [Sphingobacterium faecium]MDH5825068.1 hypothetical protein [Sphingobacterium faecium]